MRYIYTYIYLVDSSILYLGIIRTFHFFRIYNKSLEINKDYLSPMYAISYALLSIS